MDLRSEGGVLIMQQQLMAVGENHTKFAETESDRSNTTAASTTSLSLHDSPTTGDSDDGSEGFLPDKPFSPPRHNLSRIDSSGLSSQVSTERPVLGKGDMKTVDAPECAAIDGLPSINQSENIDLDHLDAGDMFPHGYMDTPDNSCYASRHGSSEELGSLDMGTPPASFLSLEVVGATTANVDIQKTRDRKAMHLMNGTDAQASSMATSFSPSQTSLVQTPTNVGSTNGSVRPVLYSAIGSLEDASANSYGNLRSQYKALSSKDFSKPAAPLLLPPSSACTGVILQAVIRPPRTSAGRNSVVSVPDGDEVKEQKDGVREKIPVVKASLAHRDCVSDQAGEGLSKESTTIEDAGKRVLLPKDQAIRRSTAASALRKSQSLHSKPKRVSINESRGATKQKKPVEMFRPSCDAYTPRVNKKTIKYKPAEMRTSAETISSNMGTLSRPNFRDALKRVAMIIRQHVVKIERRFESSQGITSDGLFRVSMMEAFSEEEFSTPKYKCTMVRLPMARPGMVYGLRKVKASYSVPTEQEIYEFGHRLFNSVQLSSECSIVCLIYVERLMEVARVPLVARTWRPIFMCGLLLASKVWQDLSSWNIEFASVYPQFSLDAINRLELQFLKNIKWDLYISSSLYAKYYFALRSLLEKQDFRMRYNRMVGGVGSVDASEALKVQQRSEMVREEALLQLSRSM